MNMVLPPGELLSSLDVDSLVGPHLASAYRWQPSLPSTHSLQALPHLPPLPMQVLLPSVTPVLLSRLSLRSRPLLKARPFPAQATSWSGLGVDSTGLSMVPTRWCFSCVTRVSS